MGPETKKRSDSEEAHVLVLSHCILNRATRWWQEGKSIERNQGPVSQVLELLSSRRIGAVQMACPEFTFFGNPRPSATKDEYENSPAYRSHCESLARYSAQHLKTLVTMSEKPSVGILAVVGVERSPSCGVEYTPRIVGGKTEYVEEKGLYLELLEREMKNQGLAMPLMGIDLHRPEEFCQRLNDLLNKTQA